jgi:hypothetical protein
MDSICPICIGISDKNGLLASLRVLGTSFFVSKDGFFLTAKHVLNMKKRDDEGELFIAVPNKKGKNFDFMPFTIIKDLDIPYDISLCWSNVESNPWEVIEIHNKLSYWAKIATIGYAETAQSNDPSRPKISLRAYRGDVMRYVNENGIEQIKPHPEGYEISIPIVGGLSGSPLIGESHLDGKIYGINVSRFFADVTISEIVEVRSETEKYKERTIERQAFGFSQIIPMDIITDLINNSRNIIDTARALAQSKLLY